MGTRTIELAALARAVFDETCLATDDFALAEESVILRVPFLGRLARLLGLTWEEANEFFDACIDRR